MLGRSSHILVTLAQASIFDIIPLILPHESLYFLLCIYNSPFEIKSFVWGGFGECFKQGFRELLGGLRGAFREGFSFCC